MANDRPDLSHLIGSRSNRNESRDSGGGGSYNASDYTGYSGNGMSQSFMDRYNQIVRDNQRDGRSRGSSLSGLGQRRNEQRRQGKRDEEREGKKEANALDRAANAFGKLGENIQNLSGAEEAAKTEGKFDDAVSFLGGLVTGTLSAPFTGASQMYEAFTGRRATEMDDEGYIPEEDLDLGQKVATGISGGINLVGPWFGGSGEMVRSGSRAIQAGLGKLQGAAGLGDDAVRAAASSAGRAFEKATEGGRWGIIKSIGGDALEEGIEEFVQSPLDEIRADTLDEDWLARAANAGALGALGGGIMSGGSIAVNKALSKVSKNSGDPAEVKSPVDPDTSTTRSRYGFQDRPGTMVKDAQDVARETLREEQTSPGSASVLQVSTGTKHGLDDGSIGADVFKAIFDHPDGGRSAKMVSDWFGVDLNTMIGIMRSDDYARQLEALHQQNKKNGTAKSLVLGRNPDTSGGVYTVDIDHIVDGAYIDLSPATFNFVKSDVDGDKVTVYFDPSIESQGYVSERLVDPVKGKWDNETQSYERTSNIEHSDFSFIPRNMDSKDVNRIFQDVFSRMVDPSSSIDYKTYADRWTKGDSKTGGKVVSSGTNGEVSAFFDTMLREIDADPDAKVAGHSVVSELYRELAADPGNQLLLAQQQAMEDARYHVEILSDSISSYLTDVARVKYDETQHGYQSRGEISDIFQKIIQAYDRYNMAMAKFSQTKTNVMFRQDGKVAMTAQAEQLSSLSRQLANEIARVENRPSVIENLMAIAMRQSEVGGRVENSVSGVFSTMVSTKTDMQFFSRHQNGVRSGDEIRNMMSTFIESYNEYVGIYNKAVDRETTDGRVDGGKVSKKRELNGKDPLSAECVRAFIEIYGDRAISRVLDISDAPALVGYTFSDWIEAYVHSGRTSRTQFGGYDSEIQTFIDRAIESYYARIKGSSMRMQDQLGLITQQIRSLYANGVPDQRFWAEAEYLVTSLRKVFDPKIANAIGLVSVESIDGSRWGEAIKSGSQSEICNFVVSAGFAGKYDTVYREFFAAKRALEKKNGVAAEHHRMNAMYELQRTSLMSDTDFRISREIYRNIKDIGSLEKTDVLSNLYNAVTSMDMTFDEKMSAYSPEDSTRGTDLLIDAITTESIGPGQADISQRYEKSYSQLSMALRASYSRNLTLWESIYSQFTKAGDTDTVADAIVDLMGDYFYETSSDVMANAVYTTTTIANSMKEKGLTPSAVQQVYQQSELNINGMLQSFHDKVFGRSFGLMSADDFQSNPRVLLEILLDPSKSIRVYDAEKGGDVIVDRQKILDEAVGGPNNGSLTFKNLDAVFRKWPQLITLIPSADMVPGVSNETGTPTIQPRMSEPVISAITKRVNDLNANKTTSGREYAEGSEWMHKRNMKLVKATLMNDVYFGSVLIRRLGIEDGDFDLRTIKSKVEKMTDRIAEYILDMATTPKLSSDYAKKLYRNQNSQWVAFSHSMSQAYDTANAIADLMGTNDAVARKLLADADEQLVANSLRERVSEEIGKMSQDALDEFLSISGPGTGSQTDAVTKTVKSITSGTVDTVKQSMEDMRDVVSLLHQAFPNGSVFNGITASDISTQISDIKESVQKNKHLSDDQKSALIRYIDDGSNLDVINKRIEESIPTMSDRILTIDDFSVEDGDPFATRLRLLDKIKRIERDSNFDKILIPDYRDDLERNLSKAIDGDESVRNELIRFYNSIVVRDRINRRMFESGQSLNTNMVNAYFEDQQTIDRMIRDSREALRERYGDAAVNLPDTQIRGGRNIDLPVADFSDPIIDIMCNRSAVNTTRGPAALTVGLNGSETRTNEPLAFIPRDIHTDIAPRPMTYADIIRELQEDSGYKLVGADANDPTKYPFNRFINAKMLAIGDTFKPGSAGGDVGYSTVPFTASTMEQMRQNPNMQVLIFDPIDSANGIDQEHSYELFSPMGSDSLSVLMALARLGDGSQEGLALKLSKTVGNIDKVVSAVRDNGLNGSTQAVAMRAYPDAEAFRQGVRQAVRRFRIGYRDKLMAVFTDDANSVLGLGYGNATDFANLLTPYVQLETSDGIRVIDTKDVMSDDGTAFASALTELEQQGIQVLSAKPVSVTPELVSQRIAKAATELVSDRGRMPSRKSLGDAARAAVTDWRGSYSADGLSVSDVLDGMLPRSASADPFVVAEDDPSNLNAFLDAVRGEGESGKMPPKGRRHRAAGLAGDQLERVRRVNESQYGAILVKSGKSFKRAKGFMVAKAFGAVDAINEDASPYNTQGIAYQSLENAPDDANDGNPGTVGILLSADKAFNAIQWSCAYRQDLLIPAGMLMDPALGLLSDADVNDGEYVVNSDRKTLFYRVSPYRSSEVSRAISRVMKSKSVPLHRSEIVTSLFDYTRYLADSSGLANRATMSDLGTDVSKPIVQSMPDLFDGIDVKGGTCRIATSRDIAAINDMLKDGKSFDDVFYSHNIRYSKNANVYRESVMSFLSDMAGTSDYHRHRYAPGDCIAIIAAEAPGSGSGMRYVPIMADTDAPNLTENARVMTDGANNVIVVGDAYATLASYDSDDASKVLVDGVPYKAIEVSIDEDGMPMLAITDNGTPIRADMVFNYETFSGRTSDTEINLMLKNLWYAYLKYGGSVFYEYEDGKWKRRKVFDDQKIPDAKWESLVNGRSDAWNDVIDGTIRLSEDNEVNQILVNIARNARKFGIPLNYLFSSVSNVDKAGNATMRNMDVDYSFGMSGMSRDQILKLFNHLNPNLCPKGIDNVTNAKPGTTMFDQYGRIYVQVNITSGPNKGKVALMPMDCSVGPARYLHHSTFEDRQSQTANYSHQHAMRQSMDRPPTNRELQVLMTDVAIQYGDYKAVDLLNEEARNRKLTKNKKKDERFQPVQTIDLDRYFTDRSLGDVSGSMTYKEYKYRRDMLATAKTFSRDLPIIGYDGEYVNPEDSSDRAHLNEINQLTAAKSQLETEVFKGEISWQRFKWLLIYDGGTTVNNGNGEFNITVQQVKAAVKRMVRNFERTGLVIATEPETMTTLEDRYSIPLLDPDTRAWLMSYDNIASRFDYDETKMLGAMRQEAVAATSLIDNIISNGNTSSRAYRATTKRKALQKFLDWACHENGIPNVSGYVWNDQYVSDMCQDFNRFWAVASGNTDMEGARKAMEAEFERTTKKLADLARQRNAFTNTANVGDRKITQIKGSDADFINRALDYATRLSQAWAVMSPSVMASNVIDKGVHVNLTFKALEIGRRAKLGTYATPVDVNQDVVRMFADNPMVQKTFKAYRMSLIDGSTGDLLNAVGSEADLDAWMQSKAHQGNMFTRFTDATFNAMNGGDLFLRRQINNFINYFFLIEHDAGHDFWFAKDADGARICEKVMAGDNAGRLLIDVLTGRNPASFDNAQVAMNFALQGDMAQRNAVSMLYQELCRRFPAAKFLTTTFVSRFFQYRTNQVGRTLQWVAPVSSFNYAFTKFLADWGASAADPNSVRAAIGRAHVEDAQVFTSLKRALVNDVAHLAPTVLALLLASMPGLIEPPEDEKKWGNPEEWLFFGMRIYTDWELEDILGMTLPWMAFFKSAQLGQPRLDILANGIASQLYGNPIAKMSDIVAMFGDGEGSLLTSYEEDVDTYADAKGGAPSWSEWLTGKFSAAALSYFGQFITPSFLKEFIDEPLEHSYNRIYEETTTGALTEEGAYGRTMRTTYQDAQIRKVTRSNPVLGWLMDWATHPNTSYLESGMPLVEIYDPEQMASMRQFSIYDADGNPKPWDEQEATITEIISLLQQVDDMEALAATGFYLDYDTRQAVGDTIWDICTQLTDQYNQLYEDGSMDYYVLGEGDYNLGMRRAAEIRNAYYDELNYWKSIYYDKLESEPMRRSLTVYNRYKTSYARDDDGEYYATGYRTYTGGLSSILPVQTAPGTVTSAEGTMGYEGDFMTPSAVTGNSTGQRALIPAEAGYYDLVDFEAHAASGDGTGYSNRWNGKPASTSGGDDGDDDGGSRVYPWFSYGGYGYGGRGGGGGGGYTPDIYSRLPSLYPDTPRTMYSERLYDPNYHYLRPDFETKGSREAYRRSDF